MLSYVIVCYATIFKKKNLNESFLGINSMNNKNDFISLVIVMHINIHCKSHTAFTQVTNKTHGPLIKCNMKAKTWNSCNTRYRINRFNNYILALFRASNRVKPTYIFIIIVNVKFLKANTFWLNTFSFNRNVWSGDGLGLVALFIINYSCRCSGNVHIFDVSRLRINVKGLK